MPKMISVTSPSGMESYWINADLVRLVHRHKKPNECSVQFDSDHGVTIAMDANDFVRAIDMKS